jgi:ribonuclease HI
VRHELSNRPFHNAPERVLGAFLARTDFFGIFGQQLAEKWVGIDNGHRRRRSRKCDFICLGTNQIAELTAAIEGLTLVPAGAAVELVSDSQYVLKGLTEWRAGWERKGYRNSKGDPVANLALWKRLFAAADQRRVSVRWVRGHNGDRCNEKADALAMWAVALTKIVGLVAERRA